MNKTAVNTALDLLNRGYAPYDGHVNKEVYTGRRCRDGSKARWFVRQAESSISSIYFVCVGCSEGCSLVNPSGFQAMLPVSRTMPVVAAVVPVISDDELLNTKRILRLDEVMSICRVSERTARKLIAEGQFDQLEVLPIRVTSESVKEYLERMK